MTGSIQDEFAKGVITDLRSRSGGMAKSLRASASPPGSSGPTVGHPDFRDLEAGASAGCNLAIAFTARTFWQPLAEVTSLAQAVLTQIALVVEASGGFVLGLRGDGLMAGWGSRNSTSEIDVALCLAACTVSLDACKEVLNQALVIDGIEPIQLRAGVDWGLVNFTRTGSTSQSDVNVVGHAANFAAKCEKVALSWEVVVGEGAATHVDAPLLSAHSGSPKWYQHGNERRSYSFGLFAWFKVLETSASAIQQVAGRPTSLISASY